MMQSVSGGGHFGGGLFISAEDQARFGLLFLRNGRWMDQQLLSPEWVRSVHEPSAAEPAYGLMWWTNRKHEFPGLSAEIYYANGFGGNFIVVDPEQDLVVVARWLEPSQLNGLLQLVRQSVTGK
jgi:CubicO group peptidase (beta-lactamase class C family)